MQRRGEIGSHCDQRPARSLPHARERATPAQPRNVQAELIILGQAVGIERHAAARRRNPLEHPALNRARDARQRQPCPQRLTHHEILPVCLRKLVGIMARYEPRFAIHQRQDRQLYGGIAPDQRIDHAQFARMHHVLGIVQFDRRHANLFTLLIAQQRRP
ncbi:hypothetical protein D9M73_154020 [compost metagenome]